MNGNLKRESYLTDLDSVYCNTVLLILLLISLFPSVCRLFLLLHIISLNFTDDSVLTLEGFHPVQINTRLKYIERVSLALNLPATHVLPLMLKKNKTKSEVELLATRSLHLYQTEKRD